MDCKVTYQGKEFAFAEGTKFAGIAKELLGEDIRRVMLVSYAGRLAELFKKVKGDGEIRFLTMEDKNGRRAYRRSVVFMMQAAVERMYPDERMDVRVHFSISSGYYCRIFDEDGDLVVINDELLDRLKETMMEMVAEDIPFFKYVTRTQTAQKMFADEGLHAKVRLLDYRTSSNINIYELDGGHDYFYGYMAPSTGGLGGFDLLSYEEGFILQFP
ncbi:MAG: nucleoside kinase, partial [Lachnospiraceae bacterium]|nr:nucleoside kinase [Lachnospiraceae bacterium]